MIAILFSIAVAHVENGFSFSTHVCICPSFAFSLTKLLVIRTMSVWGGCPVTMQGDILLTVLSSKLETLSPLAPSP